MKYNKKLEQYISESIRGIFMLSLIFLCLIFGCGKEEFALTKESSSEQSDVIETVDTNENAATEHETDVERSNATITVHMCGAVRQSGVYELDEGSRIIDGINAAGGLALDACENAINLSEVLTDAKRVYIPTLEEVEKGDYDPLIDSEKSNNKDNGLININTAGINELITLKGIGTTRAEAIISYRQEKGEFKSIEEIKNVSGIGESSFEKIKENITVN